MTSTKVTDSTFENDVINSDNPVLVDFPSEWCGPWFQIACVLEELANEYKETMTVAKVNIDENPQTPAKYGVRGIPTLILFKDGQIAATKVGGTLLTATGKGATTKIGLTKTGQAVASSLTSSALSGGKKKKGVKPIIDREQEKIMS